MKTTLLISIVLVVTVLPAVCQQQQLRERHREELLDEKNSYACALYNLARERFAAHETKNEIWIFRANRGLGRESLKKFSDGEFTIASIPARDFEHAGICLYISHYNSFNLRKADELALNGRYDQGLKIIRLLKRFDNCGLVGNVDLDSRLALIERLKIGQDVENGTKILKERVQNDDSSVFESIASKATTMVKSLFDLTLDIE